MDGWNAGPSLGAMALNARCGSPFLNSGTFIGPVITCRGQHSLTSGVWSLSELSFLNAEPL